MSKKKIIGIVVACSAVILAIALAVVFFVKKSEEQRGSSAEQPEGQLKESELAEGYMYDPAVERPYGVRISKISDEGIEVYWKRTEFAVGYQVYRSYEKDSGYVCINDTEDDTNPNNGLFVDDEFDHDRREVYYRVCSYEYNDQNEKVFSKMSKIATATYREEPVMSLKKLVLPLECARNLEIFYGWGNLPDVVWTSDNPQVATVDQNGLVTSVAKGECKVTCRSEALGTELTTRIIVDRDDLDPIDEIVSRYQMNEDGIWENSAAAKSNDALILMVGDLMCTSRQQNAQRDENGEYNFNASFDYVRDLFKASDLAVGNLETLMSSSWPYMCEETYIDNKPNCNAPSRYLDAVRYAGFDCVMTSNNHNCDGGERGVVETIEAINAYQMANTGIFASAEDERTLVIDVNGIKVGYLSYSSKSPGFNGKDAGWSQESIDTMLNYIEKDKVEADVARLKERGAEYIIVYMHWGVKNAFGIKDLQREEAQILVDAGVDYITGGHAHIIQPYEELVAADGKVVPCFFSLGDFHSSINQIAGNRDSVILRIRLTRDENGKVVLAENGYIPCYNYTSFNDIDYPTIPLNSVFSGDLELKKQKMFYNRILEEVGPLMEEYIPQTN